MNIFKPRARPNQDQNNFENHGPIRASEVNDFCVKSLDSRPSSLIHYPLLIKNFGIEILFKKEFSQIDLSWSNGQNFKEDTNLVSPIFFLFDFPN